MTEPAESWKCTSCALSNPGEASHCRACATPAPGRSDEESGPSGEHRVRQDAAAGRVSSETMLLPVAPLRANAGEATVETGAVAVVEDMLSTELKPRRRGVPMRRVLPLVSVVSVFGASLVATLVWLTAIDDGQGVRAVGAGSSASVAPADHRRVHLPAHTAVIGLTDDNKETVLTLCNRASSNPNRECRRSYLSEIGEFPHREVAVGPLVVDRMEASNQEYEACVAAGDCSARQWDNCRYYSIYRYEFGRAVPVAFRDPEHPAVCLTFAQAEEFCRSRNMRVPAAHEWERAARGGDDRLWPWGRFWAPGILNWGEFDMMAYPIAGRLDGYQGTAPVDAFADGASPDGLLNLLGNVAEWTQPVDGDPEGTAGVAGGHYADHAFDLRLTNRRTVEATQARSTIGVRCVADAP